jgi:probable rRNA maturation factor
LKKISIQNIHSVLKVKSKPIQVLVETILTSERAALGVDVILVDDKFMRRLNRQFTGREGTTDVLAFPLKEDNAIPVERESLGDIYVSLEQAKRQAAQYGVGFEEEVALLVTHGLLHLLGYDHQGDKQEIGMREKEQMYLKKYRSQITKIIPDKN